MRAALQAFDTLPHDEIMAHMRAERWRWSVGYPSVSEMRGTVRYLADELVNWRETGGFRVTLSGDEVEVRFKGREHRKPPKPAPVWVQTIRATEDGLREAAGGT